MADLTPIPSPSHRTLPEFMPAPVSIGCVGMLPMAAPASTAPAAARPARAPATPTLANEAPRRAPPGSGRPRAKAMQPPRAASTPELDALTARARRCLNAGRHEEALKLLAKAQRIAPPNAERCALRGYLRHLRGDRGSAPETILDQALAMDGLCERAHHYRGVVALARHDVRRAAYHFSEAVVLDPDNREAALLFRLCRMRSRGFRRIVTGLQRLGYLCGARLRARREPG